MKTTILAVLACLSLPAAADQIDDFCAEKWPTDYEMQEYCVGNQTEAGLKVQAFLAEHGLSSNEVLKERYEANDTAAVIFGECMGKWSTDYEMLDYCLTNQVEAAERLGRLPPPESRATTVQMRTFDFDGAIRQVDQVRQRLNQN